jgi:IS5 family transposase
LEFRRQGIFLDPALQTLSDFLDQQEAMIEKVRRDWERGLKNPHTGRNGLTPPQVRRSLVLRCVRNWDYRELRERINDGYTLRRFTAFLGHWVPQHHAFDRSQLT